MQTWTQKRMQMWMKNWKKMWVSIIATRCGTTKVDEKVDVIKTQKICKLGCNTRCNKG